MPLKSSKAAPFAAGGLFGVGAFQGLLAVWDWLTAGDSLMSIYEHLPDVFRFLNHPASTSIIVVLGLGWLWWTTRDIPRPVTLYGSDFHTPLPTRKHPIVRIGFTSVVCAVITACTYLGYHYYAKAKTVAVQQQPHSTDQAKTEPNRAKEKQTEPMHPSVPKGNTPKTKPDSVPGVPVPTPSPLEIPATPERTNPSEPIPKGVTASIDGHPIRASDKPKRGLYISVRLGLAASYRGTADSKTLDAVVQALNKEGRVTVFATRSAYNLNSAGTSYGLNITPNKAKTIYYFDESLEDSCKAIQSRLISNIELLFRKRNPHCFQVRLCN